MKPSFDAYRKWLGIPPSDQPPHHYRLLGIEPFEDDCDVIANAADGRMAQVKSHQAGEHAKLSQQLLNEIAQAKVCLLSPEKKAEYDARLRAELSAAQKPAVKAAPAVRKKGPQAAVAGLAAVENSPVSSYVSTRKRQGNPWLLPVVLVVVLAVVAGVAVVVLTRSDEPELAAGGGTPGPQPAGESPDGGADDTPETAEQVTATQPNTTTHQSDPPQPGPTDPADGSESIEPVRSGAGEPEPDLPEEDPGPSLADLLDPVGPGELPLQQSEPDPTEPTEPAAGQPRSLPDRLARQEAERTIRELFRDEFAAAKGADEKAALAEKLLQQADETSSAPAARFVLMWLACELTAEAGNVGTALSVIDRMAQRYAIEPFQVKVHTLEKTLDAQPRGAEGAGVFREVGETARRLADDAVAADEFDTASRLVRMAASVARRLDDLPAARELTIREREIERLETMFADVQEARQRLAGNPNDADANLTVGRWDCFVKANWETGLPLLAKAGNANLSALAESDLANPEDPAAQVDVAERWDAVAKAESSLVGDMIENRARHWYERALPHLAGLDKMTVEKRLSEMAATDSPKGQLRGRVVEGNVALASNGTTVTAQAITGANELLDGKSTQYNAESGFAHSKWPCEWTITFKEVYSLQTIRFLLWDRDARHYRYAIAVSADGRKYAPLVDRSQGEWKSWQTIEFPARPVKAVKLIGLYNSLTPTFHVVEFEAYCTPLK